MAINKEKEMKVVDTTFNIILVFKSLFALFETLAGGALFFVSPGQINGAISWLTGGRVHEHLIAHAMQHFGSGSLASVQLMAAAYLFIHGVVKLLTLVLLWKRVLWAYPLSILVFVGFIVYQTYELVSKHSMVMIFVIIVDILMIVLTWIEYQNMKVSLQKEKKQIPVR
ncbi:DUF2127 domain-containing protein [Lactococcus termiticola]|uniref:Putative membrane protein n=1 Tax=Lactococcus termiticola TaxID=2169526 RepID=A0A2R5HKN8_9LACT|nr:DUF2127 domain-containing protein [Lactococcus termiticola]GBG97480.1 putative membrane protein [Lactococcus termiticola]